MKALVPFVVLFALAGCTPSKELEAEKPPTTATSSTAVATPKPPVGGPKTSSTPNSSTPATSNSSAPPTGTSPSPSPSDDKLSVPDPSDNPNRAFQLRTLKHAGLKINGKSIDAWLMDTAAKQTEGMMFLTDKDVKDDQGMLFVYNAPQPKTGGFWMHNTILPLDIIYIAQNHKVLNIQKGKPHDDTNLPPAASYQFVLELKQGQAEKLGMKPETLVDIPKDVRAGE
jgi:uncharacterized membrane protein (UPF0127 family)